jgi:sortase (surface protein transpeptidase)
MVLARPALGGRPKTSRHRAMRRKRQILVPTLIVLAIFMGGALLTYRTQTGSRAADNTGVLGKTTDKENNSDTLSEDYISPEIISAYSVAPDLPRVIRIPRLQLAARIKRLGARSSGELMTPTNINDTGWYDGSVKPGENGTLLIDGHVAGPTKAGVFQRLKILKEGDTIEVERGDGKTFTYKVIKLESVDRNKFNMNAALASADPGKPGLNLVSFSGRYDVRTNQYEQQVIVYAVQQ